MKKEGAGKIKTKAMNSLVLSRTGFTGTGNRHQMPGTPHIGSGPELGPEVRRKTGCRQLSLAQMEKWERRGEESRLA